MLPAGRRNNGRTADGHIKDIRSKWLGNYLAQMESAAWRASFRWTRGRPMRWERRSEFGSATGRGIQRWLWGHHHRWLWGHHSRWFLERTRASPAPGWLPISPLDSDPRASASDSPE